MTWLKNIKAILSNYNKEEPIEIIEETIVPVVPSFVSFPCDCGISLEVEEAILPGQAAVLSCFNCDLSWTVYNPSLIIKKTKEVPKQVQEVWRELSQ